MEGARPRRRLTSSQVDRHQYGRAAFDQRCRPIEMRGARSGGDRHAGVIVVCARVTTLQAPVPGAGRPSLEGQDFFAVTPRIGGSERTEGK